MTGRASVASAGSGTPICVWAAGAVLGEGALWSTRDARLYWVDVLGRRLHAFDPVTGARHSVDAPSEIGCVAERASGGLVAMLRRGLAEVTWPDGEFRQLQDLEREKPDNRFNDGKVDAAGRLWAGTMAFSADQPSGMLYRIDAADAVSEADGPYLCPNGPAFSRDGRTFYHSETMERVVYAFDLDPASGVLSGKRPFVRLSESEGFPDGMTVDAEDHLWVAHWGGARLTRYRPNGALERTVPMPVSYVTSCAFGGPDLEDLFVTTATLPLSDAEKDANPTAGGLFHLRPGVRGLPGHAFAA